MLHFLLFTKFKLFTYRTLFPQDLIGCHGVAVIRHVVAPGFLNFGQVVVPGFLNFGRRGLLAVVVDWGLLGGM